jgi:hypothetical protein
MSSIKLAEHPQLSMPADAPSRTGVMLGNRDRLKEVARVDDPQVVPRQDAEAAIDVEQVAQVLAGIPAIGWARRALEAAGWHATIAGNRITVNYEVYAHFIAASVGQFGQVDASWVVYTVAGTPPVWIVGAERVEETVG